MTSFLPVPNPVAFSVFGLDIMWYAVMITIGAIVGGYILCKRAPSRGLTDDNALDMILYITPVAVIGARAYYVLFEWSYYSQHLDQIFNTRGGGLAIHGVLIAIIIMVPIICKKRKQSVLDWLDLVVPGVAIGQAIGRWGNYFNSEAHGTPTDLPWHILCDGELVHPTFLYESIWCMLLCIFLLWLDNKHLKSDKGFKGQLTCLYGIIYSVERFFVEGLRTDSLYLDAARTIRQAQVISVATIVVCLILYFIFKKRNRPIKNEKPEVEVGEAIAEDAAAETEAEGVEAEVEDGNEISGAKAETGEIPEPKGDNQ